MKRGVEVRLNTSVAAANFREITLADGETMPISVFVWTAGVKPDEIIENLPFPKEKGRLLTDEYLQIKSAENMWAVGDCAAIPDRENNGFYTPLAQHAERQGAAAASNIIASVKQTDNRKQAFRYRSLGRLATIGHLSGIANVFNFRFSGFAAWLLWRATYLYKLPTFERKLRVLSNWAFDAVFARDVVQFISMNSIRSIEKRKQMIIEAQETLSANNVQAQNKAKPETVFQK